MFESKTKFQCRLFLLLSYHSNRHDENGSILKNQCSVTVTLLAMAVWLLWQLKFSIDFQWEK